MPISTERDVAARYGGVVTDVKAVTMTTVVRAGEPVLGSY